MSIPARNNHHHRKSLDSTRPLDLNLARTLLPAEYQVKKKAKGAVFASFGLLFPSCNLGPDKANPLIRQLGVIRVAAGGFWGEESTGLREGQVMRALYLMP